MKILHVGEYVQGGVATYIKTLLNHPSYSDIEDYLICSEFSSEHNWPIDKNRITFYSYERKLSNLFSAIKYIFFEIKRIRPDVVYCHSTWAGLFVRLPLLFTKKKNKIIYNAHGWSFLRDTAKWKRNIYALVERILAFRTDKIINVSNYEYEAALKVGINKSKLSLIYSGISSEKTDLPAMEFPLGKINLLFVGRFDAPKGIDYLLQNFKKCERKDIHLTVIGDNVVGDSKKIEMKNTDRISFRGWVPHDELGAYYKGCDAVIIPSRWEAFGLVGVEAMKYGKPIIVSNRGALPELVKDGANGYIFDFEHPISLINLLESINKKELYQMGAEAKKIYSQNYRSEQMIEKTIKAYKGMSAE